LFTEIEWLLGDIRRRWAESPKELLLGIKCALIPGEGRNITPHSSGNKDGLADNSNVDVVKFIRAGRRNRNQLNHWGLLATLCCSLAGASALFVAASGESISKRAHDLHFHSIVLDTHDDTTERLMYQHFDIAARHPDGSVDIPRMREGGLNGLFFSIFIKGTITGPEAVNQALDQIDAIHEMVRTNSKDLALCATAEEVRSARSAGKIAVLMGLEGGHMIGNDLGVLRSFSELGVRYMTLTHMVNTDWADSSTDAPAHNGLTAFGKDVVIEMNRVGMMVDISHVSDKTFYDALEVSRAPLIASHSSCRQICDAPRNMTDDMIKALAAKGGVIQINYHVGFLSQQFLDATTHNVELTKAEQDADTRCGKNLACQVIESQKVIRQFVAEGRLPRVSWEEIVDHIDHAVKLVGADHVGLGSDFDGANMPFGMEDASQLPKITEALLSRGYSESDIRKILGGNTLRVMEQVEATAKQMREVR
jgi:membrane dipeptidase